MRSRISPPNVAVSIVFTAALASCAPLPGSGSLVQAKGEYETLAQARVFEYDPEIEAHLQRADDAITTAEHFQNLFFTLDTSSAIDEVEHYAQVAMRELEMARLLAQTQEVNIQIAQLQQRRSEVMLAANERRERLLAEVGERSRDNQRLETALANAEARGAEVRRDPDQITVTFRELTFDFDRTEVREEFRQPLIDLAEALKAFPRSKLIVEGYTDSRGSEEYNKQLSEQRAVTVKAFLIEQGIQPQRIVERGRGEVRPVASNDSERGRARNRRVELIVETPP